MSLADFPTDDATLDLLEACMDAPGRGLSGMLRTLSGYDPERKCSLGHRVSLCAEPSYHRDDVIRALVTEVRRLRAGGSE